MVPRSRSRAFPVARRRRLPGGRTTGTLGAGIQVILYFVPGDRSAALPARLKDWMTLHNAVITSVLCLVIAMEVIGDGISGRTA